MTPFFLETATLFRDLVCDMGLIDGMTFNGVEFNIVTTPDQDRAEQTQTGYRMHKESLVDVLRDNFCYWDGEVWAGIKASGLYDLLLKPSSRDKRPEVYVARVTYQVFSMQDDKNDATVKLTLRRAQ